MENQKGSKEKWKNTFHKILAKFSYVMVFVYLIFSLILLLTSKFSARLEPIQRYSVGGMLLVYSLFRAYRIYVSQKETTNEEDE